LNILEFQIEKLHRVTTILLSPGSPFSLAALAVAFAIAFGFLARRQIQRRGAVRPRAILRAIMTPRIIFSRSTYADLFYFFINTFAIGGLIGWALISGATESDLVIRTLRAAFGSHAPSTAPDWALRPGITLFVFLGFEFGYYVDHYLKHKISFLWEFHKPHHTAEVLTPLTVFRVHPIDTLIFFNIVAVFTGLFHGVFIYAAGKDVNIYVIDGTNIITVAFLFLSAQLQHSQFWIPLRGLPGHIILSPAHHQIHHSIDPAHYDRNLGAFVAIFDWMFGRLSIPQKRSPHLKFGVLQSDDDPHRIMGLMTEPVANAFAVLVRRAGAPSESVEASQ